MEAQNNVTKVKFKKLIHSYEDFLVNKNGKRKKDYIGQLGIVIHITTIDQGELYDVQFDDGQVWCNARYHQASCVVEVGAWQESYKY